MNYNLSPKTRAFQDAKFPGTHHALIESDALEFSLETALAEYAQHLALNTSEAPICLYYKLAGAHEFLFTLRNLAEKSEAPAVHDTVNLSQNQRK